MSERAAILATAAVVLLLIFIGASYQIVYNLFSWVIALVIGASGLLVIYALIDIVKTSSTRTTNSEQQYK